MEMVIQCKQRPMETETTQQVERESSKSDSIETTPWTKLGRRTRLIKNADSEEQQELNPQRKIPLDDN